MNYELGGEPDLTFREKVQDVWRESRASFREAPTSHKLFLGASAVGMTFEWGTGNEALLGMVGGNVLDKTGDPAATGITTAGVSFAEQTALGLAMAINVKNFPRPIRKLQERFLPFASDEDANVENKKLSNRFLTAFALGSSAVVLAENTKQEKDFSDNCKSAVAHSGLIAGGVAAIAVTAAGATNLGRAVGAQEASDIFVEVIKNPGTWATLFLGKVGFSRFKNRKNRSSQPVFEETL